MVVTHRPALLPLDPKLDGNTKKLDLEAEEEGLDHLRSSSGGEAADPPPVHIFTIAYSTRNG